ncbi:Gfo/Idh/MocA family oxidoreductase [bacterium]|nr:Gfo/Idh/MocA family oxidoreductase [bacterium]
MIRWGLLGLGRIAHKFADGVKVSQSGELYACGSRSEQRAREFSELHNIPNAYSTSDFLTLQKIAKQKGLFLMEGMWNRFNPVFRELSELKQSGKIGSVDVLQSRFSFQASVGSEHRLWSKTLAGGTLWDIGA